MCGIAGIYSDNPFPPLLIENMTDQIKHRGPDDEGFLLFNSNLGQTNIFGGKSTPSSVFQTKLAYLPEKVLGGTDGHPANLAMGAQTIVDC
jgi:asparagine synthase (glutamine-hydrolysing)